MSPLAIQLLGLFGFGFLLAAPLMRAKQRFLIVDAIGLVPVAVHYALLEAPAGAGLSVFYLAMNALVVVANTERRRAVTLGLFVGACLVTAVFWTGPADLAALIGTLFAAAARLQTRMSRINALLIASTLGWFAYGLLTGSIGQVLFSSFYAVSAALGIMRNRAVERAAEPPE